MCLEKITKFKVRSKFGYKIFEEKDNKLYFQYGYNKKLDKQYTKGLPVRKWILNNSNVLFLSTSGDREVYANGFHIFKQRNHAIKSLCPNHIVKKIKFDKVLATGIQWNNRKIIVSNKIQILPEKRRSK